MEAYRDQYATLFKNGQDVIVLGVSTDSPEDLAAWAKDLKTPVSFGSDAGGDVGSLYGARTRLIPYENRHLIIVGPDGKITYEARPFRVMAGDAYTELGDAVAKASGSSK
jgi:peroxiredoxin Q/BCP